MYMYNNFNDDYINIFFFLIFFFIYLQPDKSIAQPKLSGRPR